MGELSQRAKQEARQESKTSMIDTENLTKKFGDITAVDSVTLHVDEGEVFGFLGPNGAGKTTTVRMLCCLISKTSGEARIGDYDIGRSDDALKIRRLIGLVPDNVGLYEALSAYDNMDFYGKLYDRTESQRKESIAALLKMLELWEKKDVPVATFSKGMKQKLAIALALVHDPHILFMDEPTANLDPEAAKTVRDFILDLKKQKKTIFLNTHNLDEAQRICDRIAILNTTLRAMGTPEELEQSVRGKVTLIQLEQPSDAVLAAVKKLGLGDVLAEGNKLTISTANPEKENATILDAVFRAGGRIQSVNVVGSTLEDAYLKLVREREKV
jgi:ABC-2 type transport system ATP-binding protein